MSDEKTQPIEPGPGDEPTVPVPGPSAAAPGTAAPDPAAPDAADDAPVPGETAPQNQAVADAPDVPDDAAKRRLSGAGAVIGLLLVLLGFTLAVQLKSNSADEGYQSLREEDLYVILADLDSRAARLRQDIAELEANRRELASGASSREQILKEAQERADDLGILAGTLKAQGSGITLTFSDGVEPITAEHLLNAIQELRGAGAEAIQIDGTGGSVRVIASTHFVDAGGGGIEVDGLKLTGPYTVTAIGPEDLDKAMEFRGGVADDVRGDGGNVIVSDPHPVDIATVRGTPNLEYAKPVS